MNALRDARMLSAPWLSAFWMTALPAARAGMTSMTDSDRGKFQGVMTPTSPFGR